MITLLNLFITFLFSFLTISLFPHFRIFGVVPLVPLFFIVQLAYFRKGFEPILIAALTGLYFDIVSASPFGLYLMIFLISAGLVRYFFEEGLREYSFWHYMITILAAILVYLVAEILFMGVSNLSLNLTTARPLVLFIIVNAIFASLMYIFGRWYFEKLIILEDYIKRR